MFKVRCDNCGTEHILVIDKNTPLICAACGGHLSIVEDMRKEVAPVIIPYVPTPMPSPPPYQPPYYNDSSHWEFICDTVSYYSAQIYPATFVQHTYAGYTG